jgi:hypothetical protein
MVFVVIAIALNATHAQIGVSGFRKVHLDGYILCYLKYNDSLDYSLNETGYFFLEDKGYKDVILKNLYDEFNYSKRNKYYQLSKINSNVLVLPQEKSLALLRSYEIFIGSMSSIDSSIKAAISSKDADYLAENMNKLDSFIQYYYLPFIEPCGIYINIKKVQAIGYLFSYTNFPEYEHQFINSSLDLPSKKLVGFGSLFAKLENIYIDNTIKYPGFLPVKFYRIE